MVVGEDDAEAHAVAERLAEREHEGGLAALPTGPPIPTVNARRAKSRAFCWCSFTERARVREHLVDVIMAMSSAWG